MERESSDPRVPSGPFASTTALSRKEQLTELGVFLFLIVPSMALSFLVVREGNLSFVLVAVSTILRDLGLTALILFFLWRNGEPFSRVGLAARSLDKEIAWGILLFPPFFMLTGLSERAFRAAGLSAPSTPTPSFLEAQGSTELLLGVLLVTVVALAEETIFRGYLLLRFRALSTRVWFAVLASAVLFALGHGYEGTAGVATVGVMGVLFAVVYLWRKSLVSVVVMHFLQDFIGIVLWPWLGRQ